MRDNIRQSISDYVEHGVPLGNFLTAVMEHDLFEAFARADEENAQDMREIVRYVHWDVPSLCHGSRERVRAWLDKHSDAKRDAARDAEADKLAASASVARELLAAPDVVHEFVAVPMDPELCRCGELRTHITHDVMPAHLDALICKGCGQEIDPDTCGCGAPRKGHGSPMDEGHAFVPLGCDCAHVHGPRRDTGVTPSERGSVLGGGPGA